MGRQTDRHMHVHTYARTYLGSHSHTQSHHDMMDGFSGPNRALLITPLWWVVGIK